MNLFSFEKKIFYVRCCAQRVSTFKSFDVRLLRGGENFDLGLVHKCVALVALGVLW